MSDEKVNVSDLTDALARRIAITKKNADLFVTTFQDVFQEALLREKNVKISGLGTFRLQWVEPRRSVNVQTGEPIEISGHYKVVFAPETGLKERVNEPFAHLETTSLEGDVVKPAEPSKTSPLQKLANQAVEIQTILSSINEQEIPTENEPEVVTYESLETPVPIQPEPTERRYTPVATIEESKPLLNSISTNASLVPERKKLKLTWLWILLAILGFCGGAFAAYYFYGSEIKTSVTSAVNKCQFWKNEQTPIVDPVVNVSDSISAVEVVEPTAFDQPRVYTEFIASIRVPEGGRLTLMAQKYYGHKDFWVYIYEANKDKFSNPDNVEVGTLVRIPKLNPELINLGNPEALVYARKLHDQYVPIK